MCCGGDKRKTESVVVAEVRYWGFDLESRTRVGVPILRAAGLYMSAGVVKRVPKAREGERTRRLPNLAIPLV